MAQRIRRFGVAQTAKVLGVLYLLVGLCLSPLFLLTARFAPNEGALGFGVGFALVLPVLYGLGGFVFTAIGCLIYNLIAGWVGGIEFEIGESAA
jgi:hypothetical protein